MLYLHMGMPKTGTSSIQRYFSDNAEQLSKEGIEYPLHLGRQHHALGIEIGKAPHERSAIVGEFLQYLSDQRDKTVVVSSETLTNALGRQRFLHFVEFIQKCERLTRVQLVLFMRRFDSFFQSMYLQSVTTGKTGSEFDDYLDERKHWIDNFLASKLALERVIQPEKLIVVGYRRGVDSVEAIRKIVGISECALELTRNGSDPGGAAKGIKAISFLKNYDLFAGRLGLRRPITWWRREIWRSRFSFKGDILTDYSLYTDARAAEIHSHGLKLSRSLGEMDYWSLFKDESPTPGLMVTLRPEQLNDEDTSALQSYEKTAKQRVRAVESGRHERRSLAH